MFPPPSSQVPQCSIQTLLHLHGNGASVQPSTQGYDTSSGSEPFPPVSRALLSADGFHFTLSQCHSLSFAPFPACPLHSVMSRFGPYLVFHRRRIHLSSEHGHHTSPLWIFRLPYPMNASTMGHGGPLVPVSPREVAFLSGPSVAALDLSPPVLGTGRMK